MYSQVALGPMCAPLQARIVQRASGRRADFRRQRGGSRDGGACPAVGSVPGGGGAAAAAAAAAAPGGARAAPAPAQRPAQEPALQAAAGGRPQLHAVGNYGAEARTGTAAAPRWSPSEGAAAPAAQRAALAEDPQAPAHAPRPALKPEVLAPAGGWPQLRAAVENGADAVYFGLAGGFNARARAANFEDHELAEVLAYLHERGVKGFVTLNVLVRLRRWCLARPVARRGVTGV